MTRKRNRLRRRTVLKSIGLAAGGTALLPGSVSAQSNTLAHELNTVRAATREFRDVAKARVAGYGVLPELVSPYTPNMGFHFVNPLFVAPDEEGPFDLESPPVLVYAPIGEYRNEIREAIAEPGPPFFHDPDRDDELRLVAVEFAHLGDVEDPPADPEDGTPADIFSDEEARRNLKFTEADGWEWVPGAEITALHVWVHRGNPEGVFHPTNPTID